MFDIKNVHTTLNAGECNLGTYGYFSNDLESLRDTVQYEKTNFRSVYAKLEQILEDKFEKRFYCNCGAFSLFYPTDKSENSMRY